MRARLSPEKVGLLMMVAEDLVWGIYPVLAKDLTSSFDPYLLAGISGIAAGLPFLLFLLWRGLLGSITRPRVAIRLCLVALTGTVLPYLFFFAGAERSSGLNVALLGQIEPVYSLLLAGLVLREVITRRQLYSTALLLLGAVIVVYQDGFQLQSGDIFLLIAPFWYQVAHLIAKRLFDDIEHVYAIPAVRMTLGGSIVLLIALVRKPELVQVLQDPHALAVMAGFGIGIVGAEKLFWYEALKRLDLGRATALLVPSVGVGVLGAWWLLGEVLKPVQGIGLALMVAGLVLLTRDGLVGKTARAPSEPAQRP